MLDSEIPLAVTVLPVPTFLSLNVGVLEMTNMSPDTRSSLYVTDAVVVRSYTLFTAEIVTVRARRLMVAVVVVDEFGE